MKSREIIAKLYSNPFRVQHLGLFLLALLFPIVVLSQNAEHRLKVYLTDAENGRNVKDARVTLEGFEIPAIDGKYDKKCKCYYFDTVPEGYNTVMSYHKDYNEKGYQDVEGLPAEIKLKLYDPLNVSYEIGIFPDSVYDFNRRKNVGTKYFRDIYVEDPYKVAIIIFHDDCERIVDAVDKLSLKYNLKIETLNPYFKFNNSSDSKFDCNAVKNYTWFPVLTGKRSKFEKPEAHELPTIFIRKKDGSPFKRFNDSTLTILRENKFYCASILWRKTRYEGQSVYKKRFTRKKDKLNNVSQSEKSKHELYSLYDGETEFTMVSILGDDEGNEGFVSKYLSRLTDDGIGLGIVDQLDYINRYSKDQSNFIGWQSILYSNITTVKD